MAILERHVHHVSNTSAFWERERKFKEAEDRIGGFPAKRYYYLIAGTDATGTMTHEREWVSMAAMEAAYDRLFAEPGIVDLAGSSVEVNNTERTEYYLVEEPH